MALDEKEAEKDDIHFSFQSRRPEISQTIYVKTDHCTKTWKWKTITSDNGSETHCRRANEAG